MEAPHYVPAQLEAQRARAARLRRMIPAPPPKAEPVHIPIRCDEDTIAELQTALRSKIKQDAAVAQLRNEAKYLTRMQTIRKIVCENYGIDATAMDSYCHAVKVTMPRQIAMYLCRKMTTNSLPQIGRRFANRDHTTVLHAVKKIAEMRAKDEAFNQKLAVLENTIRAQW